MYVFRIEFPVPGGSVNHGRGVDGGRGLCWMGGWGPRGGIGRGIAEIRSVLGCVWMGMVEDSV